MKEDEFSPSTMDKVLREWKDWQRDHIKKRHAKKREYGKYYGMAVKIQRARRGITQVHLAQMLGIHKSVLAKIEIGTNLPSDRIHQLIVQILRSYPETVQDRHFHVRGTNRS